MLRVQKLRGVFVGLLLSLAFATSARAQIPGVGGTRPISFVVSGGSTLPTGHFGDRHDSGFHYDASLLLQVPGFPIVLRPEFSFTQFKFQVFPPSGGTIDGTTQLKAALLNFEVPVAAGLYGLAGGGILSLSREWATNEASTAELALAAGAGFRFALGAIRAFVEARICTASLDEGKFGFSKAQFIPITFGLVF